MLKLLSIIVLRRIADCNEAFLSIYKTDIVPFSGGLLFWQIFLASDMKIWRNIF